MFGGVEPLAYEPGYAPHVRKYGGLLALETDGVRRHVVGYVQVRNASVTERSVVSLTNFLPVGGRFLLYQTAEYDVQPPAGHGRPGLNYFFTPPRHTFRVGKTEDLVALLVFLVVAAIAVPSGAAVPPDDTPDRPHTQNMHLIGSSLRAGAVTGPPPVGPGDVPWDTRNTDLAFWGDIVIQGRYDGFRVIDIKAPGNPTELAFFSCVSPQGDVGVYGDLVLKGPPGATVELTGGDYVFCSIKVARRGRFHVSGPSTVSVVGDVAFENAVEVAPLGALDLAPDAVDRNPAHVVYRVMPEQDAPALGVVHDHAYWVSDVTVAPGARSGLVDVRSLAAGEAAPAPRAILGAGIEPTPHVKRGLEWTETASPAANALEMRLEGTSAAPLRAEVDSLTARVLSPSKSGIVGVALVRVTVISTTDVAVAVPSEICTPMHHLWLALPRAALGPSRICRLRWNGSSPAAPDCCVSPPPVMDTASGIVDSLAGL